jgi:hypothetical protein
MLVELVEDRPGREQVLGGAEGLLDRPQLLVAEHGFERVEIGVGAQHEDAVEPFVLLDLIGIDPEVILADRLQVAAIAGVADQRLVALGELPLQCGYDRSAIGGILRRLLMVRPDPSRLGFPHAYGYAMLTPRSFPRPWSVIEIPGGYRVDDASGKRLGYFYSWDDPNTAHLADVLTADEARRLAEEFAKLPES